MQQGITALRADGDPKDLARALTQNAELCLHLEDMEAVEPLLEDAGNLLARLDARRIHFAGRVYTQIKSRSNK